MSARLPMFPLSLVMLPHLVVPLHIFEPRYRVLMFDCTHGDADPEFGIVLIERGREVGGNDQRFGVGTVARIVGATELPDGRWVLNAAGTHQQRLLEIDEHHARLAQLAALAEESARVLAHRLAGE